MQIMKIAIYRNILTTFIISIAILYCCFLNLSLNAASVIRELNNSNVFENVSATSETRKNCLKNAVTVVSGGRMCNQIFEYASVWGVRKRFGLTAYVPDDIRNKLDQIFEGLDIPSLEQESYECRLNKNEIEKSAITPADLPIDKAVRKAKKSGKPLVLWKYIVLKEVLLPYAKELRNHFKFRSDLVTSARAILQDVKQKFKFNTGKQQILYVGIHVRRTDYISRMSKRGVTVQAGVGYYRRAVAWMDSILREEEHENNGDVNIAYVVASDDMDWCKDKLIPTIEKDLEKNTDSQRKGKSSIYYVGNPGDPVLDLVLLSSCNHSIISYGTYGMWTALMTGGWIVYYDVFPFNNSPSVSGTGPMEIAKTLHKWRPLA